MGSFKFTTGTSCPCARTELMLEFCYGLTGLSSLALKSRCYRALADSVIYHLEFYHLDPAALNLVFNSAGCSQLTSFRTVIFNSKSIS
jgi:hypothetical protein